MNVGISAIESSFFPCTFVEPPQLVRLFGVANGVLGHTGTLRGKMGVNGGEYGGGVGALGWANDA